MFLGRFSVLVFAYSSTQAIEKSKDLQAAYHIDCNFLVQNLSIEKNCTRLLSVQLHKLRLSLFCNQTTVIIIIILIVVIVTSIGNLKPSLALDFQTFK